VIDDQIKRGRLLHREIARLRPLEDPVDVDGGGLVMPTGSGPYAISPPAFANGREPYIVGTR
jgi:hypothetical protein